MTTPSLSKRADVFADALLDSYERLDAIERLVRKHSNPASNPGAHRLAAKIIHIIETTNPIGDER